MVHANEPGLPRTDVSGSEFEVGRRLQRKKLSERKAGRSALQRVLSRLFLGVGCSLFYIVDFQFISGSFLFFPGDAETIPGFPVLMLCRLAWRLMGI